MASDTPPTEWRKEVTSIVEECEVPGVNGTKLLEEVERLWGDEQDLKLFTEQFQVKLTLFNDPIHGSIQLNMLENAIVNTPEFYRLKEIKQLGGKNHVFPGATHTRFEHSIGVCHLAGKFIKHLKERSLGEKCTDEEVLCVRLAGLCHDLGHGPFSHLFEKVTKHICPEYKVKHEEISGLVFKRILVKNPEVLVIFLKCNLTSNDVTTIVDMINCSDEIMEKKDLGKEKMYLYEIVANKKSGMDVDKWDYFARDCHYLGLKNEFDMERCIALSSIVTRNGEYHVGFREKELKNIYGMFRTRCILFQKAYSHKTGNGIDLMIKDALIAAKDVKLRLPGLQNDTSLQTILMDAMRDKNLEGYILLTDSFLGALMIMPEETDGLKKAQRIVQQLSKRNIYRAVCSLSFYCDKPDPSLEDKKKKLKEDFNGEDYEVEIVPIEYASEHTSKKKDAAPNSENGGKTGDPVAGNMYFFTKEDSCTFIPEAKQMGKQNGMEACSKLILPKAFIEYRTTLYCKTKERVEPAKEKEFERSANEMMPKK